MSDELRAIEREIRDWTSRPPARSPRVARTRVLARIGERSRWRGWLTAAAALAVALAFTLLPRGPGEPPGPTKMAGVARPTPGLLVYELQSGTKLYLELASAAASTVEENATPKGIR